MLLSASRRTDIPAFFGEWFANRLRAGYAMTRNPFNPGQIRRITISPDVIDCIVFWTKNPQNFLDKLEILDDLGYMYYFLFTLTPYGKNLETELPEIKDIISVFRELSLRIGKDKVIWRYDPILLSEDLSIDFHTGEFERLASELYGLTGKCIMSYVDMYKKCVRNLEETGVRELSCEEKTDLAGIIAEIALDHSIKVFSCAEEIELTEKGIEHGRCMDDILISRIIGEELHIDKDTNQRKACGCVQSIDIGAYNTCLHNCLYCYANYSRETVLRNYKLHDPDSPLLIGNITEQDVINDKEVRPFRSGRRVIFR